MSGLTRGLLDFLLTVSAVQTPTLPHTRARPVKGSRHGVCISIGRPQIAFSLLCRSPILDQSPTLQGVEAALVGSGPSGAAGITLPR